MKIAPLLVLIALLAAVGFFADGFTATNAQQVPRKPVTDTSPDAVPTPPILDQSDDVIEIDSEVVNVLFTAQDRKRKLVTTLKQEDVRILENGKQQEIVAFTRRVDLPLSLTILIDTSQSQVRTLPEEKEAAKSFLESVVRPSKDEVAVISFSGEATLEQGMTNNISRLRRAVDRVNFVPPAGYSGGGVVVGTPPVVGTRQQESMSTAIWDAVWVTSEEILGPAPEGTRRAIVLLTDGANTYGTKSLDDAVNAALKAEAVIYSIGIGDNFYRGVDKDALNKISENTGGKAFYPRDELELRKAFDQIQEEMRSQYLLAYEPIDQTQDGSYRKIEIQIANGVLSNENIKLTHREGYFAKSSDNKPPATRPRKSN
ncbi:MAG: VWA domain-containing protein [Acidobacteriota bacterium]|nr:VWA domain-containing protein [Acidobacteriota bacterium]MDH3528110.1 VWA domain-containing protein [Acidobacteriota bacterium]